MGSTLHMVLHGAVVFQVFIEMSSSGKTITLKLNMSDTVLNIKNVIEVEERIRQDLHILYYGAKQLNDTQKLELQIFVNVARKTIPLEVKGWHTVRDIKAKIQSVEQILIHAGKRLVNSHTLAKYDLKMDPIAHLVCPLMDIFIRIRPIGKMVSLKVKKWDLVANVKALISEKKGIPLQQQTLTHDGEPLKDEDTLSACGIGKKSTLDMDLCPRSAMQVYICKKNQEFVQLEVRAWYAVIDVKNLIQCTEGRLHDHLELVYKAVPLKDSKTLSDYGIKEKSTLFMVNSSILIYIEVCTIQDKKTLELEVSGWDNIHHVKNMIHDKFCIPPDSQRFIFAGKVLEDSHLILHCYGIEEGSTLNLVDCSKGDVKQIIISMRWRKSMKFSVKIWYTVHVLKAMITSMVGLPIDHQILIYNQNKLSDSRTLFYYNIEDDCTIQVIFPRQIFIKTWERTIVLDVEKFDTIDSVMNKVGKKLSFTTDCLRLMFIGKSLQGHQTLADYGIQNCTTLELAMDHGSTIPTANFHGLHIPSRKSQCNPMTIYSVEFSPHCLPYGTQLIKPTSHYHHHNSVVSCRTNDSVSSPRNPPKARVSAEPRPTHLQTHEYKHTHLIKLLNRSYKSGKYNESLYFLECMVNKGFKPGVILCTKLMKGFFNSKIVERAIRVMEILESHGEPDVFAYNVLISGLCKVNQIESANQVLNRMRNRGFLPDIVTYNIIIGSLCSRGKLESALKVLNQLLKDNCKPTVITYTILIEATILEGGVNDAMKLLDEMLQRGLQPDIYTYNAIIRGLCREGMLDRAFDFVRSLPGKGCNPDVISYNMLLREVLNQGKWNDGEKLVTKMCSIGCKPNVVTYSILISSLCRKGKIDEAVSVLKLMMEKGLSPGTYSYDPLISALCREGKLVLAIELLDYMISTGCSPDIVNYNTILSALCKNGNADHAMEIFDMLGEIGCPPDVSSYNTMFSALWNNGDRTRALRMISEMVNKRIEPDEITYNSLISCLCRDGMVDEAIGLLGDMEGSGFRPTVITYNIVLLGLCKAHRIDNAIDTLAEMVEKGCLPNETTCILLVEGIGFAGWRPEAMELANSLFTMDVISKDSFKRLNKTFPMLDVYKEVTHTGNKK
ncbi:unnamed protein product [Camellia sinensis]